MDFKTKYMLMVENLNFKGKKTFKTINQKIVLLA